MNCPICGREITDETLICDGCGDMTACRIQSENLHDLRRSAPALMMKPFCTGWLAAVYAGLTSLIFIFSVMLFAASIAGTFAPLKMLFAALFAVFSGFSAYGCWRSFFAGPGTTAQYVKKIRVLPSMTKIMLMISQMLLLVGIIACMVVMIIIAAKANKGDYALADWVNARDFGILTYLAHLIADKFNAGTEIFCVILAVLCAVCVVPVGGLAGSFNKIRKQYKTLTDYTLGKSEKPLDDVKYISVYIWGLIITVCGILCIRKTFDNVCFGLLAVSLGLYVILSAVMLRLVKKQTGIVAAALDNEQTILDSLTERTERVAAYRAYRSEQAVTVPDDTNDEDVEDDEDTADAENNEPETTDGEQAGQAAPSADPSPDSAGGDDSFRYYYDTDPTDAG